MRRLIIASTMALLLALAALVPAMAHEHDLTTPGTCTVLPQEPSVIHDADPTGGAVPDNDPNNPNLHPIHNNVHKGMPGAQNPGNSQVTITADTNVNGECG